MSSLIDRSLFCAVVWIVLSCLTVTFLCLYISASDSKSSTAANRGRQESSEESADSLFYSETGYHPFAHFQLNSDYRGVQRTQASSQGMVASDHGECSDMGGEILKKGGNAMDAAVTTALCIGIHNPFASGTGGGAFILMHLKDGTSSVIDAREVAPRRATQDMFQGNERHIAPCALSRCHAGHARLDLVSGGLSIAVPLEMLGLEMLWKQHGSLTWKELIDPVIPLARDGFRANPLLVHSLQEDFSRNNVTTVLFPKTKIQTQRTVADDGVDHGDVLHPG